MHLSHSTAAPGGQIAVAGDGSIFARSVVSLALAIAAVTCCGQEATTNKVKLTETELPGTRNAHVAGNVYLAGQPSEEALGLLAKKGVKTVITLRHEDEERWDEQSVCETLGLEFIRLTISSPDDLDPKLIDKVREQLNQCTPESCVLLHCASANRVGAVWLAHRVKDGKLSLPESLEEAKRVGLASKELQAKAFEYLGEQ